MLKFVIILFSLLFLSACSSISVIDGESFDNTTLEVGFADTSSIDSFGRLRVSQVTSLLDVKQLGDNAPLFIDEEINGGATSTYINSSSIMETSTSGDYVIRQSFQRSLYQNGKSQQILMTMDNFQPETNIIKRIGYYNSLDTNDYQDNLDGIFLESSDSEVKVKIYKNGSEVINVPQTQWNIDALDGSGTSGININWENSQIFEVDFEWLGVGRVRFSLVVDGTIIPFHYYNHANNNQGVYMISPNQPIRWEIRQTGVGSGKYSHICASVGSEGALNQLGVERSINSGDSAVQANDPNTEYAVLGIRLNNQSLNDVVTLLRFNLFGSTNDNFHYQVHLNPTLSTEPNWQYLENSAIDWFQNDVTVTSDGIILDSGYVSGQTSRSGLIDNALRVGTDLNLTSDIVVIAVQPLTTNLDVYGSLTFKELK